MTPEDIEEAVRVLEVWKTLKRALSPSCAWIEIYAVGTDTPNRLRFQKDSGLDAIKLFLETQLEEIELELKRLGVVLDEPATQNNTAGN